MIPKLKQQEWSNGGPLEISDLISAAYHDETEKVRKLLDDGVDVNSSHNGYTALHIAGMHGNSEMVNVILNYRRKLNFSAVTDDNGFLAWQLAAKNGHFEIAERIVLAENNAKPSPKLV